MHFSVVDTSHNDNIPLSYTEGREIFIIFNSNRNLLTTEKQKNRDQEKKMDLNKMPHT